MIRTLLTLFLAVFMSVGAYAQSKKLLFLDKGRTTPIKYTPKNYLEAASSNSSNRVYTPSSTPVGSRTTNEITVIKIGEASNAFSTLAAEINPVSVINGVGDGVVAFAHRHNIQKCDFSSGGTIDNGRIRYSISTDGGNTWNIGDGVSVSADMPALQNQCFGIGPVTEAYTFVSRYPQSALTLPPGGSSVDDVMLAVTSSTLASLQGGQWNGSANITVQGAATSSFSVSAENYDETSGQAINYSLVERVPGEFWYIATEFNGDDSGNGRIYVYKGVYNSTTMGVEWNLNSTIQPQHNVLPAPVGSGSPLVLSPNIAFSPDGETGFISFIGDLMGAEDSVFSPIFIESTDGGNTWGTPYEFNISDYPQIADSLQQILGLDSIGVDENGDPLYDTIPFSNGKATAWGDSDLTVDADGNPHLLSLVGASASVTNPQSGYSIFSGIYLMMYDFTKDDFGDWSMLYAGPVSTLRGKFPSGAETADDRITIDVHPQMSRSQDGTKIFMSWTDTDTTDANFGPLPDPDGGPDLFNINPNLITRAYDLTTDKMSVLENRTLTDPTWSGGILLPKASPIALNKAGSAEYTVPTVFANIDGVSALNPTSYYYISDITYNSDTDFTEPAIYTFSCKTTPFANQIDIKNPACDGANGSITVNASGGTMPFSYKWEAVQGDSTVSIEEGNVVGGLTSGIYKVTVIDDNGCKDENIVNLNNEDAPSLTLVSSSDISCFGAGDGSAEISVTGGTGDLTYEWSNGETTANAMSLPKGTSTVIVSDANNCQSFISVTINEPTDLSVESTINDVSCNGFTDGSVLARVQGGTLPYTYNWSNSATSAEITDLAAGTYNIMITDANNCQTMAEVTVSEPEPLALVLQAVVPNSNPMPPYTGAANANVSGGTPFQGGGIPYTFIWCGDSSESNTFFKPQLPGGPCVVTIIDANGCSITDTVVVDGVTVNINDPKLGINSLNVFPNPSTGVFNLELELAERDQVSIRLFDMQGKLVEARELKHIMEYTSEFDLNKMAEGVYLLTVTTTKGTTSQRLVVRK